MDTKFLKQAVRAIGGRLRSALTQLARDEAARAVRHFRERMQAPRSTPGADAGPIGAPPVTPDSRAGAEPVPPPEPPREPAPDIPGGSLQATAEQAAGESSSAADALLDINVASKDDLRALKGIGAARADAIIQGRPYLRPAELVERRILPASVYEAIRGRIRGG